MKYYSVYEIDKENNDLTNIFGSENREQVADVLQVRIDNLARYTTKNIEIAPRHSKIINNKELFVIVDIID